ncbi:MAG: HAMP domain-containing sensor histidine kinase, partial [Campylobacterota bacterium]|nr:HAMP domain-containing sensor histidine kinase [Campylobacterota bacterium]
FAATAQLAAGITHEINTPITYIKANFEMMQYDIEDLPDSNIKNSMESSISKINDGIHRVETIISSMKELSQQLKAVKEDANIYSSLIRSAILAYNKIKNTSRVYINGKEFNPDMDKDEFKFIANIELQRIEQVWVIIINNAMDELMKIDQFDNRRLDIDIVSDNQKITVTFKDNAGGIDKDIMEYLFEPFKGTKDSSGMGVGLSIAKRIIDDQKCATIDAYNDNSGAVFKVTLSI